MSTTAIAVSGPFEPDPCVTQGGVSARSAAVPSTLIVIVVVTAWLALVTRGVSPEAATAGLGAAAGLGLRIALRLANGASRA